MPEIAQLIGGAGTGKTTRLLEIMAKVIERGISPLDIGFVSFTRAARREASTRAAAQFGGVTSEQLEQEGWFRTLHSICYRALGVGKELLTENKESRDWLSNALQGDVKLVGGDIDGQTIEAFGESTDIDKALMLWHASRNRLQPLRAAYDLAAECAGNQFPSWEQVSNYVKIYEQAKRFDHRCDFTDLLAKFAGYWFSPTAIEKVDPQGDVPYVQAWFLDEQQDTSALLDAVCRRLVEPSQWCYVVGDPFQCQPRGTNVLTDCGTLPIERLDPKRHRIVGYVSKEGRWTKSKFQIASRKGAQVFYVKADGVADFACSTANHRWPVRWIEGNDKACCVYLMRKGNKFRVGWCQLFHAGKDQKNNGGLHLATRANIEGADDAWILKVFRDRTEASTYESYVAAQYGLPTIPFRPVAGANHLTRQAIDTLFDMLKESDQRQRATHALCDHGRLITYPFWSKSQPFAKQGKRTVQWVRLCNVMPDLMMFARKDGDKFTWHRVQDISEGRKQTVYSLNVEGSHNYIADGFWTGNSIYGWAGADGTLFQKWNASKREILRQSYRCPDPMVQLGERILRAHCSDYWDREMKGAAHGGAIDVEQFKASIFREIEPGDEWLILARSNFHARRVAGILDSQSIPWVPTRGGGGWGSTKKHRAIAALYSLEKNKPIDVDAWRAIIDQIPQKSAGSELLLRGAKAKWSKVKDGDATPINRQWLTDDFFGCTPQLLSMIESGKWGELIDKSSDVRTAIDRWGAERAIGGTKVRVGTIHSAKGAEADNVMLLTTASAPISRAIATQEGENEEGRVWYVGATRARKRLIVTHEPRASHKISIPA